MGIINDLKRATREGGVVVTPAGGGSAPSGGGIYYATFTPAYEDYYMTGGTIDKTVAEIFEAYNNGQLVILINADTDVNIPITYASEESGLKWKRCDFSLTGTNDLQVEILEVSYVNEDGVDTVYAEESTATISNPGGEETQ